MNKTYSVHILVRVMNKMINDKKDEIIKMTGYWEMDEKSKNILREQEKEKEKKQFMRLHQKQISEILKW